MFFLLFVVPNYLDKSYASNIIFQDNFDSDTDGSFPSGWSLGFRSNCSNTWQAQSGKVGLKIQNQACISNIYPDDLHWNGSLHENYSVDLDATFINGTDHNIIFWYSKDFDLGSELHFQLPGDFTIAAAIDHFTVNVPQDYLNGHTYHIKIVVNKLTMQVYIDGLLVRDAVLSAEEPENGRIALRVGTGGDLNTETRFDNLVVTSLSDNISLNVPEFKQTSVPWKTQTYDGANNWFPSDPTINRWGCAMTSAAMMMQYYGFNKLPDGTSLDPGTLNNWLKTHNGYEDGINNGYLLPNALTQLSKLAKTINNITSFDLLESNVIAGFNLNQLKTDLQNNNVDVLGVNNNSHFVIAKGIDSSDLVQINDPFYNRTSLADYGNSFASLTRYTPASSDGSYITAIATNNVAIDLKDDGNTSVGSQFVQSPIIDPLNGIASGISSKNLFFQKPLSGTYKLNISSSDTQAYKVNLYLYDQDANLKKIKLEGLINQNNPETVTINFNHLSANSDQADKIVTFESFIEDINEAETLSQITKPAANKMIEFAIKAQKDLAKGDKFSNLDLDVILLYLNAQEGHSVSSSSYNILSYDATFLKSHL